MNPEQDLFFHFGKAIFGAAGAVRRSVYEEYGPATAVRGAALKYIAFAAFAFRSVGMERAPGPQGANNAEQASHGALNLIASLLDELVAEERTSDFKRALPTLRLMGFPVAFDNALHGTSFALKPDILFQQRSTFLRVKESAYTRAAYSRQNPPSLEEITEATTLPLLRDLYKKRIRASSLNPYLVARDDIMSHLGRLGSGAQQ